MAGLGHGGRGCRTVLYGLLRRHRRSAADRVLGEVLFDPVQGRQSLHVVLHQSLTSKSLFVYMSIVKHIVKGNHSVVFPRKRWQISIFFMSGNSVNSNDSIFRVLPHMDLKRWLKHSKHLKLSIIGIISIIGTIIGLKKSYDMQTKFCHHYFRVKKNFH